MIRFENNIDIERQPDDVFAYIADLEHTPEWNWAITSSQKTTPGPVRIGSKFRQSRTVPLPGVEVIEIVALDASNRLEVAGMLGPFRAHLTYDLEETSDGTRLTNGVELELPIPLGPIGDLLSGRVRVSVAENLHVLKRLLEARGHGESRHAAQSAGTVESRAAQAGRDQRGPPHRRVREMGGGEESPRHSAVQVHWERRYQALEEKAPWLALTPGDQEEVQCGS